METFKLNQRWLCWYPTKEQTIQIHNTLTHNHIHHTVEILRTHKPFYEIYMPKLSKDRPNLEIWRFFCKIRPGSKPRIFKKNYHGSAEKYWAWNKLPNGWAGSLEIRSDTEFGNIIVYSQEDFAALELINCDIGPHYSYAP